MQLQNGAVQVERSWAHEKSSVEMPRRTEFDRDHDAVLEYLRLEKRHRYAVERTNQHRAYA